MWARGCCIDYVHFLVKVNRQKRCVRMNRMDCSKLINIFSGMNENVDKVAMNIAEQTILALSSRNRVILNEFFVQILY